jgi:hypothetical protein
MCQSTIPSVAFLGAVCLCAALSGCGPESGEQLVPVAGRVTLNGQPLTTGTVSFRPDSARDNASLHHPTGAIDEQGNYSLSVVRKKGAPLGWYKVLVFADANVQQGAAAHPLMPRWLVPAKYLSEKTTPLSIEVVASPRENAYDLPLSP